MGTTLCTARWFGIPILLWKREDAELCIRAELETLSAHKQIALFGGRKSQLGR